MIRTEIKNGYVYIVEGRKGFETYYIMGKDPNLYEEEKKKTVKKEKPFFKKEEPKTEVPKIETIEQKETETKNEQD